MGGLFPLCFKSPPLFDESPPRHSAMDSSSEDGRACGVGADLRRYV